MKEDETTDLNRNRIDAISLNLRMKCPSCGHWNRVPVNKIFIKQPSSEPKVRVLIPMYEPLEVVKCKKYGKAIVKWI